MPCMGQYVDQEGTCQDTAQQKHKGKAAPCRVRSRQRHSFRLLEAEQLPPRSDTPSSGSPPQCSSNLARKQPGITPAKTKYSTMPASKSHGLWLRSGLMKSNTLTALYSLTPREEKMRGLLPKGFAPISPTPSEWNEWYPAYSCLFRIFPAAS